MSGYPLTFFYGLYPHDSFIDVTEIVYSNCIVGDKIVITHQYLEKDALFTDPIFGYTKSVTVLDSLGNVLHVFDQHEGINLNLDGSIVVPEPEPVIEEPAV